MSITERMSDENNTTNGEVDVIILGVGTSGEDLSLQLLDAGLEVVGIESSLVGGECPYWACLPTKMMIRASNALQEARRVNRIAGHADIAQDWAPVAARVREMTGGWDDSFAVERFGKRGGLLVKGRGKLAGPRTVTVGDQRFTARRGIVIATGSKPVIPPVPGLEKIDYWTTHDLIQAEELPRSLIVLGGGVVGCELGQIMARFGVEVTIVEALDRLLPGEEPEASAVLQAAFQNEGIQVMTGAAAQYVQMRDGAILVSLEGDMEISGERLLVATGRKANLLDLGLESIGLDSRARQIPVDERLRVADGIWVMGDVTGIAMFTHVAMYQSAIVAADILDKDFPPARYDAVPRAAFTDPEIAAVGMTEAKARNQGLDVVVIVKQIPATFRGWVHGSENGMIKMIVDRETDVLVGATVAGPHAGEMLGFLTLAVHKNLTLSELQSMIYAFPTFYGGIGEAIGAYGRGVTTVLDPEYDGIEQLDAVSAVER